MNSCVSCGNGLSDDWSYCPSCGGKVSEGNPTLAGVWSVDVEDKDGSVRWLGVVEGKFDDVVKWAAVQYPNQAVRCKYVADDVVHVGGAAIRDVKGSVVLRMSQSTGTWKMDKKRLLNWYRSFLKGKHVRLKVRSVVGNGYIKAEML